MTHGIVVAVDGPAGSGKSSVSRAVARALGYDYLDTGAMYRALAWLALDRGIDVDDAGAVIALLSSFEPSVKLDPAGFVVHVGETDVTQAIRDPRVSEVVSRVARVPQVRAHLTALFRQYIDESEKPGIITEGRDITTVVAPDAPVRVLMAASEEVRMARRAAELDGQSVEAVGRQLASRDAQDSRVVDFMTAADGVITLDSTELTFDQTVAALTFIIQDFTA